MHARKWRPSVAASKAMICQATGLGRILWKQNEDGRWLLLWGTSRALVPRPFNSAGSFATKREAILWHGRFLWKLSWRARLGWRTWHMVRWGRRRSDLAWVRSELSRRRWEKANRGEVWGRLEIKKVAKDA